MITSHPQFCVYIYTLVPLVIAFRQCFCRVLQFWTHLFFCENCICSDIRLVRLFYLLHSKCLHWSLAKIKALLNQLLLIVKQFISMNWWCQSMTVISISHTKCSSPLTHTGLECVLHKFFSWHLFVVSCCFYCFIFLQ